MGTPPAPPPPPPPNSPYQPPSARGRLKPPLPGGGGTELLPWEERGRLGWVEALTETIRLVVTSPTDAFSRLREDQDLWSPISFTMIVGSAVAVINQLWSVLLGNTMMQVLQNIDGFEDVPLQATGALQVIFTLILAPLFVVIGLFVTAGIYHLFLMVVGATADSPMNFEGTLKVAAYSQVAGLSQIVPILGGVVFFVWSIVLGVLGFQQVHRCSQGQAIAAALLPWLLCCVCSIVTFALMGAAIGGLMSNM